MLSSNLPSNASQDDLKLIHTLNRSLSNTGAHQAAAQVTAACNRLAAVAPGTQAPVLQFLHRLHQLQTNDAGRGYQAVQSRINDPHAVRRQATAATAGRLIHALRPPAAPAQSLPTLSGRAVGTSTLTESDVVRDVLYAMQGIDSTSFKYDTATGHYHVQPNVAAHTRDVLVRHALECAAMYKRSEAAIARLDALPDAGQTVRTLAQALRAELTDHYDVIAGLADQQANLCLERLAVWFQEPYYRLRAVVQVADVCLRGRVKGGALLSALHRYSNRGDSESRRLCAGLMRKTAEPFFAMLKAWVLEGVLRDQYGEFCISEDQTIDPDDPKENSRVWEEKFQFDETQTPLFIDVATAKKAMLIGKTLYFLRASCRDYSSIISDRSRHAYQQCFTYESRGALDEALTGMQAVTSPALVDILRTKFHLADHLVALKSYLLLAHGDFARRLMLELMSELEASGQTIQQHKLNLALEEAKAATVGRQDPPHVLDCVHISMEQAMANDIGWNVIVLDYIVTAPVNAIVTPQAVALYQRAFGMMWRLQRLEHCLTTVWLTTVTSATHIFSKTFTDTPEMDKVVRKCCAVRQPMLAFVHRMQSFIGDGLTRHWAVLMDAVGRAQSLDEVIDAQNRFLHDVILGTLLGNEAGAKDLYELLGRISERVLAFYAASTSFLAAGNAEAQARVEYQRSIAANTGRGTWGETNPMATANRKRRVEFVYQTLARAEKEFDVNKNEFTRLTSALVEKLRKYGQNDPELQYLAEQIDFNDYFTKHKT